MRLSVRNLLTALILAFVPQVLFAGGGQEKETDVVLSRAPAYISPGNPKTGKDTLLIDNIKLDIDKNAAIKRYDLKIYNKSGSVIFTKTESNLTGRGFFGDLLKVGEIPQVKVPDTILWPGTTDKGEKVADGEYFYQLTILDSYGKKASTAPLAVVVDTVSPDLLTLSSQFKVFSPNKDGVRDTVSFAAKTGPAYTWTASVLDSTGAEIWSNVQTAPGDTAVSDLILQKDMVWDGSQNANGKTGQAPEGSYTFKLVGADRANNQVTKTIPITINFSSNEIQLSSKDNRTIVRPNESYSVLQKASKTDSPQTWALEFFDENDIVVRRVRGSGTPPPTIQIPLEYNAGRPDVLGDAPKDGNYYLMLSEYYENGNVAESDKLSLKVDGSPPIVGLSVDTTPVETKKDQAVTFGSVDRQLLTLHGFYETGAKAQILLKDLAGNVIKVDSFETIPSTANGSGRNNFDFTWDGEYSDKSLTDGRYTIELIAIDPAGNQAYTRSITIYRDSRAKAPLELSVNEKIFSPSGDKAPQTLTVFVKAQNPENLASLVIDFVDEGGKVVDSKTFTSVPSSITWGGVTSDGQIAKDGDYKVKGTIVFNDGTKKEATTESVLLLRARPTATIKSSIEKFNPGDQSGKNIVSFTVESSDEAEWQAQILNSSGKPVFTKTWAKNAQNFDWNGQNDKGENVLSGMYSVELFAINKAGNKGGAKVSVQVDRGVDGLSLSISSLAVSPNKDGIDEKTTISFKAPEMPAMTRWSLVFEREGGGFSKIDGRGKVPSTYVWDGKLADGTILEGNWKPRLELYGDNTLLASFESDSAIVVYTKGPSFRITPNPEVFSPDGDGVDDKVKIGFQLENSAFPVKSYTIEIMDPAGIVFKTYKGEGDVPQNVEWDGKSEKGEVVESAMDYGIVLTTFDTRGTKSTSSSLIQTDILVYRVGDALYISLPGIYFAGDESDLFKGTWSQINRNLEIIRRLAEILKRYPEHKIEIIGHATAITSTDAASFKKENTEQLIPLSLYRAGEVQRALAVLGIAWERMVSTGMGGNKPVVPFNDKDQRWKNRRVEFVLRK